MSEYNLRFCIDYTTDCTDADLVARGCQTQQQRDDADKTARRAAEKAASVTISSRLVGSPAGSKMSSANTTEYTRIMNLIFATTSTASFTSVIDAEIPE